MWQFYCTTRWILVKLMKRNLSERESLGTDCPVTAVSSDATRKIHPDEQCSPREDPGDERSSVGDNPPVPEEVTRGPPLDVPVDDTNPGPGPVLPESTELTVGLSASQGNLPGSPAVLRVDGDEELNLRSSIASTQSLLKAYLDAFGALRRSGSPAADQSSEGFSDLAKPSRGIGDRHTPESELRVSGSQQEAENELKECIYMMQRLTSTHQAVQLQVDTADHGREKRQLLRIESKLKKSVLLMQRLVEVHLGLMRSAPSRTDRERDLYGRARRWSIKAMQQLIRSHIVTLNESRDRLQAEQRSQAAGGYVRSRRCRKGNIMRNVKQLTNEVNPALDDVSHGTNRTLSVRCDGDNAVVAAASEPAAGLVTAAASKVETATAFEQVKRPRGKTYSRGGPDTDAWAPMTFEWWWQPTPTSPECHAHPGCSQPEQYAASGCSCRPHPDPGQYAASGGSEPCGAPPNSGSYAASGGPPESRQMEELEYYIDAEIFHRYRILPHVLEARLQVLFTSETNLQKTTFPVENETSPVSPATEGAHMAQANETSFSLETFEKVMSISGEEATEHGSSLDGKCIHSLSRGKTLVPRAVDTGPAKLDIDCFHMTSCEQDIAGLDDVSKQTHQASRSMRSYPDKDGIKARLISSERSVKVRMRAPLWQRSGLRFKMNAATMKRSAKQTRLSLPRCRPRRPVASPGAESVNESRRPPPSVTMRQSSSLTSPPIPTTSSRQSTEWTPRELLRKSHMTSLPDQHDCAICRQEMEAHQRGAQMEMTHPNNSHRQPLLDAPHPMSSARLLSPDTANPTPTTTTFTNDGTADERPIFLSLSH